MKTKAPMAQPVTKGWSTFSSRTSTGRHETFIYPVLGVAIQDAILRTLSIAVTIVAVALVYRFFRRRSERTDVLLRLPSQPSPVRVRVGCHRTGANAWEVRDLATAKQLLSHPAISGDYLPSLLAPLSEAERREFVFLEQWFREWPLFQEGPSQRQLHATLAKIFSLEYVGQVRPLAARTCRQLLARARRGGAERGEWDVMETLARPLPLLVIAQVIGFPAEDVAKLQRWADQVEEWFGGAAPLVERCRACQKCLREYTEYVQRVAERLRADEAGRSAGGDSAGAAGARPVLLQLLALSELAEGDPARLSEGAAYANAFFLMSAAYETTAALIGGTLLSLLQHADTHLREVRDEHGASDAAVHAAVSEALRYCSPIKTMYRECRADLPLATGETIRSGDGVTFINTALNFDAAAFDDPTAYLPARPATELRRHAAFGLGAHRCPGWRLGVLEACEAVQAVLRTCPRLRLAPGHGLPRWKPLDSLNCLEALHVIG